VANKLVMHPRGGEGTLLTATLDPSSPDPLVVRAPELPRRIPMPTAIPLNRGPTASRMSGG
jgi:hypothetical protein